jgi:Spy/CpxP family protein refolding chaperone
MTQNRQLREREFAEMRAVLTPDQRATFDQNVAQAKTRMQERGDKAQGKNGRGNKGGKFSR